MDSLEDRLKQFRNWLEGQQHYDAIQVALAEFEDLFPEVTEVEVEG